MYALKGFISIPDLTDNSIGQVAPVGEISTDSLTYAKEIGFYSSSDAAGVFLYTFLSHDDVQGDIKVPDADQTAALAMASTVYSLAQDKRFDGVDSNGAAQLLKNSLAATTANITCGKINTDTGLSIPEWVSFNNNEETSFYRLWFTDAAFHSQYDEFSYEFIPPIDNMDDFFGTKAQVQSVLSQTTVKDITDRIDQKRGEHPFTLVKTQEYHWVNTSQAGDEINTGWTAIIYGGAGNDPDQIRQALANWIVANSAHSRDEWIKIFPDIFVPTEFILTPLWHQFAIPNQTVQSGINSPVVGINQALNIVKKTCVGVGYAEDALKENTVAASTPYKTLGFLATGSSVNRNGVINFHDLHPDYVPVALSSTSFGRLSEDTQAWMRMFVNILEVAQDMDSYSTIPNGFARVIRDDMVYAAKSFQGMQYLVATRSSVINALGVQNLFTEQFPPS